MRIRLQRALWLFRRNDGSATLEMAVSSTVLFAMLFGISQMSIALYSYHFVADAARQATRYAMVRGSTCSTNTPNLTNCNITQDEIQTYVQSLHYPGIRTANLTATILWCQASTTNNRTTWAACTAGTSKAPGNEVYVNVSYKMAIHIPFANNWTGKNLLSTSSSSQMVISQ